MSLLRAKKREKVDAITAYFDALETRTGPIEHKKRQKLLDPFFRRPKHYPTTTNFGAILGGEEEGEGGEKGDGEVGEGGLRGVLRGVFDMRRLRLLRNSVHKLKIPLLSSSDTQFLLSASSQLPLMSLLGGFTVALLYLPSAFSSSPTTAAASSSASSSSLSLSLSPSSGWSALLRFALSSVVLIANESLIRRFTSSSPSPSSSLSPFSLFLNKESLFLLLVAIIIQTLSLRPPPSPSATPEEIFTAPDIAPSALQALILELLPVPLADVGHWALMTSAIFQKDFLSALFSYMGKLFAEVKNLGRWGGGGKGLGFDLMLVSLVVFLSTGLFMKRVLGGEERARARL